MYIGLLENCFAGWLFKTEEVKSKLCSRASLSGTISPHERLRIFHVLI